MDYINLILKGLVGGVAATGFAILFNTYRSSLLPIYCFGFIGVFIKFGIMMLGVNIIITSLLGATTVGFLSYFFARNIKKPPLIIAIPSVIPMIPGIFLYRMMLGFVKLAANNNVDDNFIDILSYTFTNGTKGIFILCCLAIGISCPYLLFRKDSVYYLKKGNK